MSPDDPFHGSVSIERWPWPLCAVDATAGTPTVSAVADAFEDRFGPVDGGAPLPAVLSAAGFEAVAWASDPTALRPGTSRRLDRVGSADGSTDGVEPYVLQVLAGPRADGRLLSIAPVVDAQRDRSAHAEDALSPAAAAPADAATVDAPETPGIDVEDVASVLSHDLRNPLDVAKARLRAGRETGEDEHFEHVARAHDRMERLLDDVLTLARAGTVDPTDEVALEDVAERAWSTVETEDARLAIDGEGPPIAADEDRLRRLLENLFRNSVEHGSTSPRSSGDDRSTPEREGSNDRTDCAADADRDDAAITVTVGRLEDEEPAGFYVDDDGRGLPEGDRDRLFEPGVSADDAGTGLGLAIVERIAARHGWTVVATEGAEGGARFEVRDVALGTSDRRSSGAAK